jgi:rod shape determining protein RodA
LLNRKLIRNVDYTFIAVVAIILCMSLLVLSSATANISQDKWFHVRKQVIWIGLGVTAVLATLSFDYSRFPKCSNLLYLLNLGFLTSVLIIGKTTRGTQQWISFGAFDFQPSELAKVLVIITFAGFLSRRQGKLERLRDLIPCFIHVGIPLALILAQPDLGTSLVFVAICLGMLFVAGARPSLLLGLIGFGLLAVGLALFAHFQFGLPLPLEDYQLKRLVVFINPYLDGQGGREAGWNTIQSLVAIGSGGIFGKGLYQGSQVQLNFLPEHHTDFIFSVVGEELGFVGAGLLLLLYLILILRTIRIAAKAKDFYGTLIVVDRKSVV